jgi:small subunit ribosomal protein S1
MTVEIDAVEDPKDETQAQEQPPEGEGQSMASLLEEHAVFHEKLMNREVVWVKVVQISADRVLVDIGEKSEGFIPASEFPKDAAPTVGRRVPAMLVRRSRGDVPTELSTAKARWRLGWDQAVKSFEEKSRVRGKVLSSVRGGFLVDLSGLTAFMPSSLSDLRPVRKPEAMLGMGVRCYVIEVNKEKGQVIVSRRAVLEEESKKRKEKLLEELKAGQIRIGRVNRISEAGIFIDIGGLEGLVAPADVAWKEPQTVMSKLERGQKVRVRVLRVELAEQRIALGMKQLTPHPGDAVRKKYPVKSVVRGTVTEVLKDGVRIKLSKGDIAFCPVQELPTEGGDPTQTRHHARDANLPPVWPKQGETVEGIVTGVHSATFEVAISIRRYDVVQERKRMAQYLRGAPPLTLGQVLNPEGE